MSSKSNNVKRPTGEIIKQGTLRKFKSMKKKYFVLRAESGDSPACLEYYVNDKRFRANASPKRIIKLKTCFNINQRKDLRQKNVIALYYSSGSFCIVFDTKEELEEWLKALLTLQLGESAPSSVSNGDTEVKPTFEHVWMVNVMERDMGSRIGILGQHHLCLTDHSLTLVKYSGNDSYHKIEFSLQKIRACGHVNSFFYMQVGNDTVTGAGSLWMTTEDANIAETMHATIMSACQKCNKQYFRVRSQSCNESSKHNHMQIWPNQLWMGGGLNSGGGSSGESPVQLLSPLANHRPKPSLPLQQNTERRHSLAAASGSCGALVANHQRTYSFPLNSPANGGSSTAPVASSSHQHSLTGVRDRIEGPLRTRTTSEGATHVPNRHRPWSIHNKAHSPPNHSQAAHNMSLSSPVSVPCSVDSEESVDEPDSEEGNNRSHYPHSLTPDHTMIPEETVADPNDYPNWPEDEKLNNYISMDRTNVNNSTYHKMSPNPFGSVGLKSSSPSQGSFGDTYSPSSSPLDPTGSQNCLPMSPGETKYSHSRDSSIFGEYYLPMSGVVNATAVDDGYVDMHHVYNVRERYHSGCNTSTGSTSSLFSSENHHTRLSDSLDKVPSYITHDDDHGVRGTRAWSVGSRPNNIPSKADVGGGDFQRERAFSWGSNVSKVHRSSVTISNPPLSSSHSSVEPEKDLMEMDFSKAKSSKQAKSRIRKGDRGSSGLSPPKRFSSVFGRSPPKPSPASPPHPSPCLDRVLETEPGYMDMSPVVASKQPLKPQAFPNTTYSPQIKPALFNTPKRDEYLDMNLKRKTSLVEDNNNSKVLCPDSYVEMIIKKPSLASTPDNESEYMNMSGQGRKDTRYSTPPIKIQCEKHIPWGCANQVSAPLELPPSEDYMVLNVTPDHSKDGDYMELNPSSSIASLTQSLKKVNLGTISDKNECSEKEMQYATLDLQGCDFVDSRATSSQPLSYAKIDFVKSSCKVAPPH